MDPELVSTIKLALSWAGLLAFIYYTIISFVIDVWKLRKFPGPLPVPIVGNLYDSQAVTALIAWLSKLRRQHGRIFRIFTFRRPYVVLLDKAAAREALGNPHIFVKGPDYVDKFGSVFGDGLVTSVGEKHKADRAMFGKYFMQKTIEKHLPVLCKQAADFINQTVTKEIGKDYNIDEFFSLLSLGLFLQYAMGGVFGDQKFMSEATSYGSNVIGEHIVLGIPVYKWLPRIKKVLGSVETFRGMAKPVVDERRRKIAAGEEVTDDCLTAMIQHKLTFKEMFSHLVTMIAAGHDTTAFCCSYTTYLLAQNPECQTKLKREVARILGHSTEITPEKYAELSYATNCFQESLRIYSVVPHVTRVCTKTHRFESVPYTVPAGVEILIPFCLLNRDEDEWGTPVTKFDPDRFKGISRGAASKGYFPFGYGPRACVGNTLALVEGTIMLSLLAQKFTFTPVPDYELKLVSGITMVAANGVKVHVEDGSYEYNKFVQEAQASS